MKSKSEDENQEDENQEEVKLGVNEFVKNKKKTEVPATDKQYNTITMEEKTIETIIIPSVYESAPVNLDKVLGKDVHKRLSIEEKGKFYIVGDLATEEGNMPHKNINSFAGDLDYNIMMKSALLVASNKLNSPLKVSSGFPYATFKLNKDSALAYLVGEHLIKHDSSTYSNGQIKSKVVEVSHAYIIPEVIASATAIRKLKDVKSAFMVVSLGYGTLETTLSIAEEQIGLQRTSNSSYGLLYAINALKNELSGIYNSMAVDNYYDKAMRDGYIFLNRRKIDIRDIRKKVLTSYYHDIISPLLMKAYSDKDFSVSSGLYLAGGGALYSDLLDCFKEEFDGILDVIILENPHLLAAKGYLFNSEDQGKDSREAVGIDVGNSSTIICTYSTTK